MIEGTTDEGIELLPSLFNFSCLSFSLQFLTLSLSLSFQSLFRSLLEDRFPFSLLSSSFTPFHHRIIISNLSFLTLYLHLFILVYPSSTLPPPVYDLFGDQKTKKIHSKKDFPFPGSHLFEYHLLSIDKYSHSLSNFYYFFSFCSFIFLFLFILPFSFSIVLPFIPSRSLFFSKFFEEKIYSFFLSRTFFHLIHF